MEHMSLSASAARASEPRPRRPAHEPPARPSPVARFVLAVQNVLPIWRARASTRVDECASAPRGGCA